MCATLARCRPSRAGRRLSKRPPSTVPRSRQVAHHLLLPGCREAERGDRPERTGPSGPPVASAAQSAAAHLTPHSLHPPTPADEPALPPPVSQPSPPRQGTFEGTMELVRELCQASAALAKAFPADDRQVLR